MLIKLNNNNKLPSPMQLPSRPIMSKILQKTFLIDDFSVLSFVKGTLFRFYARGVLFECFNNNTVKPMGIEPITFSL